MPSSPKSPSSPRLGGDDFAERTGEDQVTGLNLAPLANRVVDLVEQVLPLAKVSGCAGGFVFFFVPPGQSLGQADGCAVRIYFCHRVAATDDVIGGHDVGGRESSAVIGCAAPVCPPAARSPGRSLDLCPGIDIVIGW